ncbi:TDT family transporter [Lachnospiraceae bacterium LCP25S3_G4]
MKERIKRVPVPLAGVMLGVAALGNLLQTYSEGIRLVCGVISGILGLMLILKLILFPAMIKEDMNNPIMASVAGTFSMALMLLATYLKPLIGSTAKIIWFVAIALHIILIIYFTFKFMLHPVMNKVFASYYIVYVGIAVASISAPAFNMLHIGTIAFWFGFITFLLLLLLVTYRYVKFKEIPEPARPLFCIYAAPASLCLAGYIQSVQPKSLMMIGFLAVLSSIIYMVVLINLPKFLNMQFYPSYAAFTFPFVISAIGIKMTMVCLANMGRPLPFLTYVVLVETIIATVLVIYSLVRFLISIFSIPSKE